MIKVETKASQRTTYQWFIDNDIEQPKVVAVVGDETWYYFDEHFWFEAMVFKLCWVE